MYDECHLVSFVLNISGAKLEEHCTALLFPEILFI